VIELRHKNNKWCDDYVKQATYNFRNSTIDLSNYSTFRCDEIKEAQERCEDS